MKPVLYFPLRMIADRLRKIAAWYESRNRFWVPLLCGILYSFALPPFNHEFHPLFALFPFLGFVILVPMFAFALQQPRKRAMLHIYLYGYTAAFGQYYWLVFDRVEGLWYLVIIGLFLIAGVVGLFYLAAGLLFRFFARRLPVGSIVVFPAVWVLIDFCRTTGDLAFPWAFLGYSLTPLLPLSQMASVTGVWGLTYAVVLGNCLVWKLLKDHHDGRSAALPRIAAGAFALALAAISVAGWHRISVVARTQHPVAKISLLQSNIDQFHWGNNSLDSVFTLTDSLIQRASADKPDLMVLPESALLCFVSRRTAYTDRALDWVKRSKVPLIFGSLDWENSVPGSVYSYFVYNSAFFISRQADALVPYHKMQLVPFSEAMPFEAKFPILSRINLGEADFQRGTTPTVFPVSATIKAAPFICYESNFPALVRDRMRYAPTLMVNVTNDGWFGKSSGPYHHAMMARMRSIENGIPLARAANSGISLFVDPVGHQLGQTRLYVRTILTQSVPLYTLRTFYSRHGDWFAGLCVCLVALGTLVWIARQIKHLPKR